MKKVLQGWLEQRFCVTEESLSQSFCFWPRLPTSLWDVDESVPGSSLTITSVFTLCCFGVTAVS